MQNLVGQTLNRYKILSMLGEGGMGAVFRAHDVTLQRDVAIKVMHEHLVRQSDFQERFLQEARTAARLDHPGIVQVHDFGQDQNLLYIVMKFLQGDNLEKMLHTMQDEDKWLLLTEAVKLVEQVALALDYAHRQGVLHRDMKPGNIMIEPEPSNGLPYRPVITDLGLAKLAQGGVVTQDGASMGTPAYMSPEQAMGRTTDARSDVYSLGILLFELTTGRQPFPARTLTEALQYHVNTPPPAPRSVRVDLPEDLERVILRALEKDPARRYQSAAALAEALKACGPSTATIASGPSPVKNAMSLLTQYQDSLVQSRGPSVFQEFPVATSAAAAGTNDRIQVLLQDQTTRTVQIRRSGLVVGRDPDCDISLDDRKASRQHARIEFDASGYKVVDLNSTNGTYIGNKRLVPGVAEPWAPDQALRIGDSWLRLLRAGAPVATVAAATRLADAAGLEAARQRISLSVENPQVQIEPGSSLVVPVLVSYQGGAPDRIALTITGIPAAWISAPARPLQMNTGERQQAAVTISPPRLPQTRAGRYSITIRAASLDNPAEAVETRLALTVAPFSRFQSELNPGRLAQGQLGRISIRNLGNLPENFAISWRDAADALEFTPPGAQVNVAEGQETSVEFRGEPRSRRWIGGEQAYGFTAQVSPTNGQAQVLNGSLTARGAAPTWMVIVLILLCLALTGGAALVFGGSALTEASATRNAAATLTQTAVAFQQTSEAGTASALALVNANQATQQAATATAAWLTGDDDKDGLSNSKEIELNTRPDLRDTDEDGLDDGEEVNNRKTDPLKPDTDGDGLKDGDEVERGLDPLKADTDGDGLVDSADPAPLATNTATANVPGTQQALQQTIAAQTAAAQQTLAAQATAAQQTLAAQTAAAQQTFQAQTAVAAQATALAQFATQTAIANNATQTAAAAFWATQTSIAYWATQTALAYAPQSWSFPVDMNSNRNIYFMRLASPGQIRARATWSGGQSDLALIINGSGQVGYYARQDGTTGLEVVYNVSPADFAAGDTWRISLASFGSGDASGVIEITYPGIPFALAEEFTISPTYARVMALLALNGTGPINAQATWGGTPNNLALIINGPGQVGYYARQDGGSPLQTIYDVTPGDLVAGNLWRVSLVSFSDASLSGSLNLTYP